MLYYAKTKYPKIYIKSNWGNLDDSYGMRKNELDFIVGNRNKFIEEYGIVKYVKGPKYIRKEYMNDNGIGLSLLFDHTERYLTKDNYYILVSNPYTDSSENEYIKKGWQKIYKIYSGYKNCIKLYKFYYKK
jgi:hypothetical protein